MRLLLVADVHDGVKQARSIRGSYDAVIAAGDFTYKRSVETAVEALEALAEIAPVYFVPGNTDPPELALGYVAVEEDGVGHNRRADYGRGY